MGYSVYMFARLQRIAEEVVVWIRRYCYEATVCTIEQDKIEIEVVPKTAVDVFGGAIMGETELDIRMLDLLSLGLIRGLARDGRDVSFLHAKSLLKIHLVTKKMERTHGQQIQNQGERGENQKIARGGQT